MPITNITWNAAGNALPVGVRNRVRGLLQDWRRGREAVAADVSRPEPAPLNISITRTGDVLNVDTGELLGTVQD